MARLCWAQLLVSCVSFERWRHTLGSIKPNGGFGDGIDKAKSLAADVEWAAKRLPFETKCLARAMALSWTLRRKLIEHAIIFAIRPTKLRDSADALHAWVEVDGEKILGDLPGPWIETARLGEP